MALKIPQPHSVYVANCIREVERSVYGRDNRQPIHDAIKYVANMTLQMNIWCEAIGLCVVDGKLNAIYQGTGTPTPGVTPPEFVTEMPENVNNAIKGILKDIYTIKVREDIVTALTWGINNYLPVADFINKLGLTVWDGRLHVVFRNSAYDRDSNVPSSVIPNFETEIDAGVENALTWIYNTTNKERMDTSGIELREDIVTVLRWSTEQVSAIAQFIDHLGLTVKDGKLCQIYRV